MGASRARSRSSRAASGIGHATALAFARAGAGVVVADLAEEANQETASLIEQSGGHAVAVRCDVTRSEDVQAALQKAVDEFGRLDVVKRQHAPEETLSLLRSISWEESLPRLPLDGAMREWLRLKHRLQ
jgi:hypothetical protein